MTYTQIVRIIKEIINTQIEYRTEETKMIMVDEKEMYRFFKKVSEVLMENCKYMNGTLNARDETIRVLKAETIDLKKQLKQKEREEKIVGSPFYD